MSSSEDREDEIKMLAIRVDVIERLMTTPLATKRDVRIIVVAIVTLVLLRVVGIAEQTYIAHRINAIYSLLEEI